MDNVTSADSGRTSIVDLRSLPAESWAAVLVPALEAQRVAARVCAVVVALASRPPGPRATGGEAGLRSLCIAVAAYPKPVIVAVEGAQDGWGLGLCAAADLVIAARSTTFRPQTGGEQVEEFLLAYLPVRAVKWLVLGAGELAADEAARFGFVNALADDGTVVQAATELARSIGRVPADVLHMKKAANDFRLALPQGV